MMMKNRLVLGLTMTVVTSALAQRAAAAGYEKSIMWGGHSAGLAGIATPYVSGSRALYFNPAGLVSDKTGHDLTFNLSPTFSQFSGPVNTLVPPTTFVTRDVTGDRTTSYPFGLIYGATLSDKVGFGLGTYVSGGSNSLYESVDLSPRALKAKLQTKIELVEFAAGVGYKATPNLKLGASWRAAAVKAKFASLAYTGTGGIINLESTEMTDTQFTGFKLGAQYKLGEKTQLGATFRSQVNFEAKGDLAGQLDSGAVSSIPSNSLTAKTSLPMAINLGVQHDLNEDWHLFGEYVFTQYSLIDKIELVGAIPSLGVTDVTDFMTKWKDQHNVRLAAEYLAWRLPVRAGYVWTSQVTDSGYARATFTPPGAAHTLTLGTGSEFEVGGYPLTLDGAFEYTTAKGDGDPGSPQSALSPVGAYSATSYALHLGVGLSF